MAKRFKRARRYFGGFKKSYRRKSGSSGGVSLMNHVALPMAYGATRQYVVQLAQPVTSMVPFGNYADELVLGVGGYLLAKKSTGTLREVGKAVLMIESASLGSQLMAGNNRPY